jgi:hypothetical protein
MNRQIDGEDLPTWSVQYYTMNSINQDDITKKA